jgi:uncharacterized protein YndB with AHSA1/START domain
MNTSEHLDPVREIGRRSIAAGEARTARMRRSFDAPIEDVWNACTDPERLVRWFLPVSGDLRPGGSFDIEGNASGEILGCEPPSRLTLSWVFGDRPIDEVELRLSPDGDGGTLLEIEHATVSDRVEWEGESYDTIFGVATGWEPALWWALNAYLAGTLPDDAATTWQTEGPPPEVKDLMARSEAAWTALVEADRRASDT